MPYAIVGYKVVEREDNSSLTPDEQLVENQILATVEDMDFAKGAARNGFITLEDGSQAVVTGWREVTGEPIPKGTPVVEGVKKTVVKRVSTEGDLSTEVIKGGEQYEEVSGTIVPPNDIPKKSDFLRNNAKN